jgi:hypothetical protein
VTNVTALVHFGKRPKKVVLLFDIPVRATELLGANMPAGTWIVDDVRPSAGEEGGVAYTLEVWANRVD